MFKLKKVSCSKFVLKYARHVNREPSSAIKQIWRRSLYCTLVLDTFPASYSDDCCKILLAALNGNESGFQLSVESN